VNAQHRHPVFGDHFGGTLRAWHLCLSARQTWMVYVGLFAGVFKEKK